MLEGAELGTGHHNILRCDELPGHISSGRVLAAEESLVEIVDAVVEGGNVGTHFQAERSDIAAYFLAEGD